MSTAKQKQSGDRERDAKKALPGRRFVKEQNSGDCHDRGAAGKNRGHGGKRPTFLEEQKERNCPGPDADSSEQRIIESGAAKLLVPAPGQPKKCEVK